jgi:hypothetical protein
MKRAKFRTLQAVIALLALRVLIVGAVAQAQNGSQGAISGFGGIGFISIQSLALGEAEKVFAGSFGSGIFKSEDAGKTWRPANEGKTQSHIHNSQHTIPS